jgi:hypothetical protein
MTKNRISQLAEIDVIKKLESRHTSLKVIWPDSKVNSYQLLSMANRVMVANSTIGLEASALGKPVWCAFATNYDLVADVKLFRSKQDINLENLRPWLVDPTQAQAFVAFLLQRERELEVPYSTWNHIDRIVWPLRLRESFLPGELSWVQILSFLASKRYIRPATKNFS